VTGDSENLNGLPFSSLSHRSWSDVSQEPGSHVEQKSSPLTLVCFLALPPLTFVDIIAIFS
jgi:hypothetical protein